MSHRRKSSLVVHQKAPLIKAGGVAGVRCKQVDAMS